MWINQNFLLAEDVVCEGALNVGFMSLRGSGPVFVQMTTGGQVCLFYVYQRNRKNKMVSLVIDKVINVLGYATIYIQTLWSSSHSSLANQCTHGHSIVTRVS